MAKTHALTSQLRIVLFDGDDPSTGKAVYRNKNFNMVKVDASDDALHAVAVALISIQDRPMKSIERLDRAEIYE